MQLSLLLGLHDNVAAVAVVHIAAVVNDAAVSVISVASVAVVNDVEILLQLQL